MGVSAPYGYIKKNNFLIDKEAASIVKLIYKMTLEGKSKSEIRDLLNEKEILTPSEYKSKVTKVTSDRTIIVSKWNNEMIVKILRNETYIGTLIQGKFRRETFKIHRLLKNEEKEWTKIENHHKPIIEKNDFDTVQKILDFPNTFVRENEYLLPYLKCGCCDGEFIVKKNSRGNEYYYCKRYYRKRLCIKNSISKKLLEGMVLESIRDNMKMNICELSKDL